MPTDYDDDDFDGNDLLASLRKQIKEKDKALKELSEKFDGVAKRDRDRSLKDVLSEKGVNPKVAAFYPKDAEATPEAVASWIDEYGDVFGVKVEPAADAQPSAEVPSGFDRLNAISNPGAPGGDAEVLHKIASVTTEAELLALITGAGGGLS